MLHVLSTCKDEAHSVSMPASGHVLPPSLFCRRLLEVLSGEWDLTAQLRVPASSKTQVCAPACVWGPCNVISLIAVLVRDSVCEHRGGACAYAVCHCPL